MTGGEHDMRAFIAACAAAALIAVACGGGHSSHQSRLSLPCTNDATQQAVRTQPRDNDPERVDTHAAEGTPKPIEIADDELTCRIRKTLLTVSDMPAGWSDPLLRELLVGEDRIYADSQSQCHVPYAQVIDGVHVDSATGLETPEPAKTPDSSHFAFFDEAVLVFTPGAAQQFMAADRRACGFEVGRAVSTFGTHSIPLPAIGDEQFGYTYAQAISNETAESYALIRRGDIVESYLIMSRPADLDGMRAIIRKADAKIAAQATDLQPTSVANSASATPTLDPTSRQAILDSALPRADQLPAGWVPGRRTAEYDTDALHFCADSPQLPRRDRGASASYDGSGFGVGQTTIALGVGVMSYTPAGADAVMRAVGDGTAFPSGCAGRVRDIAVTWSLTRLDVTGLGDSSSAWRAVAAHTAAAGAPNAPLVSDIELDFVVFRRGNLIALIIESHAAPRTDDPFSTSVHDATANLNTFGKLVDAKLKTIESKVPPG